MPSAAWSSNAGQIAADLGAWALKTQPRVRRVVTTYGFLLQAAVKRHAHGRPGPRIITGGYNRSIGLKISSEAGIAQASVGTNAAQGRRLELGFHGTDAIGRHYNQPAYPHFGPALDEIKGPFAKAMRDLGVPPG